jgi:Phage tail tube protein
MASTQDASIGISVPESTYGTPVVTTRWFEYIDESLDFRKNIKQGVGLRVGGRVARSGRRVIPTADGGGDFSMECASKGMGLLWQWAVGAGTSTLVSAATYQQNFTDADQPGSTTLQKGLPQLGGTVDAYTFTGAMCTQWELDFPQSDLVKAKFTVDAKDVLTATAYAAPSYPTNPVNLFHFAGGSIFTGAFTAPTATALAIGATPLADVHGGNIQVNNNAKVDRYNLGGAGRKSKPSMGLGAVTGSLDVEYDSTTFRDAVMTDTPMSLVLNWTAGALGVGLETLQIAIPEIKFDSQLPMTNGTDLIVQAMKFQGLDNLVAALPYYLSMRTADIAL